MTLKEAIQKLAASGDEIYSCIGEVKSVDQDNKLCVVAPVNGDADLLDIRLQAGEGKGIVFYPAVGSIVVVTFLAKNTGYVALCSDVDKIEIENGQLTATIEDGEVNIGVGQQKLTVSSGSVKIDGFLESVGAGSGLKSAIEQLIDKISAITITTPLGPSTGVLDPTVIANFQLFKAEFAKFLK